MSDDLISRQAAIAAADRADCTELAVEDVKKVTDEVVKEIKKLPSAQPERMKGKWERHYCEDGNPDGWRCDNCDEWYYFGQTLPNFCPNCGADMRGEQDG